MTVFEAVDVAHAASGRAGGFLARSWCDSGPTRLLARAGYDLHAGATPRALFVDKSKGQGAVGIS